MQAVILAGGLATRLLPLTESVPKCMLKIAGRPFLEYQLELLKKNGLREIVLCLGHLADQVKDYFGDGFNRGVKLIYSKEKKELLGTGGALRKAFPHLQEHFLVMYGDSYLEFSYPEIVRAYLEAKPAALMLVHRNQNRWDKSNLTVEKGFVKVYHKKNFDLGMEYIDAGISVLSRETVKEIPENQFYDLALLFQKLAERKMLKAFEQENRFYEVGSPRGLQEFSQLVEQGALVQ